MGFWSWITGSSDSGETETETITIAGGNIYTGPSKLGSMFAHDFTGIVNGQQYVGGKPAPNGGSFDMDGYHGPDGKLYK